MGKPPFLHSYIVAKLIKKNKNNKIVPKKFKIDLAILFHIEKEYSMIILKEMKSYGLIKDFSGKEIVFNKNEDSLKVFLED